jgi:hypothetical protein
MAVVRLDRVGMAMMLKQSEVRNEITSIAEAVGSAARSNEGVSKHDAEIKVEHYTTDRAASAVLIKHPIGMGIQAKYGALTQAASSQGLQVKGN